MAAVKGELGPLYKCAAANGLKKAGDGAGVVVAPGELSIEPVPAGQASTVALLLLQQCYNSAAGRHTLQVYSGSAAGRRRPVAT